MHSEDMPCIPLHNERSRVRRRNNWLVAGQQHLFFNIVLRIPSLHSARRASVPLRVIDGKVQLREAEGILLPRRPSHGASTMSSS